MALLLRRATSGQNAPFGEMMRQSKVVLIVDDDEDFCMTVSMLLDEIGHAARCAQMPADALASATEVRPDIVFIDVHLGKANGFELARELRKRLGSRCPNLVMMTGFPVDERVLLEAGEAGFDHCVGKPLTIDVLTQTIATFG